MNRKDLANAYLAMPLHEKRELAKFTNCSMRQQYQYFLRPSSNSIGKEKMDKLLQFRPEIYWNELSKLGEANKQKPVELKLDFIAAQQPDVVIINGKKYLPK